MQELPYKKVGTLSDQEQYPFNPRGYPGDTTELQAQIAKDGQRTPLSVTEANSKGVHIVTRGHRRKAAIDALRAAAKKRVRDLYTQLELLADSTSSDHHDSVVVEVTRQWAEAKAEVERWSTYRVVVNGIDPANLTAVLHDMDAGIIQEPVNPVALGETMQYRMNKLGWGFRECYESLGLNESKARACVRAADPKLTAESVRSALRSGEMPLTLFIKKIGKLDVQTQARVMEAAALRAEGKNAGGAINSGIINGVLAGIVGESVLPVAPDADVQPLLAQARDSIRMALDMQSVWSPTTADAAAWLLEEIAAVTNAALKEQVSP